MEIKRRKQPPKTIKEAAIGLVYEALADCGCPMRDGFTNVFCKQGDLIFIARHAESGTKYAINLTRGVFLPGRESATSELSLSGPISHELICD